MIVTLCVSLVLGDNTYYVSSSTTDDCPQPCHPLSYYITDTATYFMSNATFIFMEGEHLLDIQGLVQVAIYYTGNLTLRGERVHSSTGAIIRCGSNTHGLAFGNNNALSIYGISITACGQRKTPPLLFTNVTNLHIYQVLVYENEYIPLMIYDTLVTHINSSYFKSNQNYSLYFQDSDNIVIDDSMFVHNRGSVLIDYTRNMHSNVTNHHDKVKSSGQAYETNIVIANCYFADNTGEGLSIHTRPHMHNSILVTRTIFSNNGAAYERYWYYGLGGGMLIYSGTDAHNNIVITESIFTNNSAGISGHGLYIYSPVNVYDAIIIADSFFTNNGGGLYIYSSAHSNISINTSIFSDNIAGSGLYIYASGSVDSEIHIANSIVRNNSVYYYGGGITIYSYNCTHSKVIIAKTIVYENDAHGMVIRTHSMNHVHSYLDVIDSDFYNNNGSGLSIYEQMGVVQLSKVIISNNKQTGMYIFGNCRVIFTERHSIIANNTSPTDGGGIYLAGWSYLDTSHGGNIIFINNIAHRFGGAIYVSSSRCSTNGAYSCGVGAVSTYLSAKFASNNATRAGDNLYYSGRFERLCWLYSILMCPSVPDGLKNSSTIHPLSSVSSDPLVVCPCINGTVNCTIRSIDREVYPGQILSITLATVGLCGGVSPGVVAVEHSRYISLVSSGTGYTSTSCTTFNYTVKLTAYTISNTTVIFNVANVDIDEPLNVNLTILPCPPGSVLNYTVGDCVCSNSINKIPGVQCNISNVPHPIQQPGNNWISHISDNCTVAHTGCPFDYCTTAPVKFHLNQSDLQCNYNRSGILCGKCQPGLSLTIGSNRCSDCRNTAYISVILFLVFALAGILLVFLLMVLDLTVSVGFINGLLFYVNIVKMNEYVFFADGSIPVVTQFISWFNFDFGIESCFVDGLDGYTKTWLQFVFIVYIWFLVLVTIFACRYSGRLSRLCAHNAVPVLATLILMSYTKLLRTVTNALMMNTLQCGEHKWHVWYVDGNIYYLSGKHIILFIVSLLFLITGLVYTGLVFSFQWLQRYSGRCCRSTRDPIVKLKPLIDAYTSPYKDKYRFWTGLGLVVRLIFALAFSLTATTHSRLNNYIILIAVGVMVVVIVRAEVYKNKWVFAAETFSYINIVVLSIATILFSESFPDTVFIKALVSVSVIIEMLLLLIIIAYHIYMVLPSSWASCKHKLKVYHFSGKELSIIDDKEEEEVKEEAELFI